MTPPEYDTLHALTRESAWLHRLARSLVRDVHRAEDAAQRALLLAVQSSARDGGPDSPRGWLASLLRNVVREDVRSEGRRRGRELAQGESEARERWAPDDALERLELQGLVVAAIRELDEPYRSTVVLRYLEGLTVRQVARRTGVPSKTVHTRLERARGRLRHKLDRLHDGDSSRWMRGMSALLALPTNHMTRLATGVGSMGAGAKLVLGSVAAAAVVGGGLWWMQSGSSGPARPLAGAGVVAAADGPIDPAVGDADPIAVEGAEERAAVARGPLLPAPAAEPERATLSGRVEDVDGNPLEDASVRLVPGLDAAVESTARAAVTTDATGSFALPFDQNAIRLEAVLDGFCEWSAPSVTARDGRPASLSDYVIILAPVARLGGRVVDEDSQPIAGARVRARVRPHDEADVTWLEWTALSGQDGRFTFEGLPLVDDSAVLSGEREGFVPAALRVSGLGRENLALILRAFPEGPRVLRGRVLDDSGNPLEGAWIGAAMERDYSIAATSDSAGAFTLQLPDADGPCTVRAVVPGFLPAAEVLQLDERTQDSVTLIIDRPAGVVTGVVLDASGAPVAGARVATREKTWFGTVPMEASGVRLNAMLHLESLTRSEPGRSDELGRFRLDGLMNDEATLIATDRVHLRVSQPTAVHAGQQDVRILLTAEPLITVVGRVVDARGDPFAGLVVRPTRTLTGLGSTDVSADNTVTDQDGRFGFEGLCVEGTALNVSGTEMASRLLHALAGETDLEDVRIVAGRKIQLTLETTESCNAQDFSIFDHEGERLDVVIVTEGDVRLLARRIGVQPNQVQTIEVDERAAFIVFQDGHEELDRIPIQRSSGEETRVVWP